MNTRPASEPRRDPNTATCAAPQRAAAATTAAIAANGWARSESSGRRLAAHENAVVMPQVGQGLSIVAIQPHTDMPSCLCVPTPVGDGRRLAAVTSTARINRATTVAAMRSPIVARALAAMERRGPVKPAVMAVGGAREGWVA